jgi:hypothetical protein
VCSWHPQRVTALGRASSELLSSFVHGVDYPMTRQRSHSAQSLTPCRIGGIVRQMYKSAGVQRGQGWATLTKMPDAFLCSVVRFLVRDEKRCALRLCGSGVIIGNVDGRWLVVATAAHVIEDVDQVLGIRPKPIPAFDFREPLTVEGRRQRVDPAMDLARCMVYLPDKKAEIACPIHAIEVSPDRGLRDTALVFVSLPQARPIACMPIDLEQLPGPYEPVLVAGFGESPTQAVVEPDGREMKFPLRNLIVREGFLGPLTEGTAQLRYPAFRLLVPTDGGMSGGPVIIQRRVNTTATPPMDSTGRPANATLRRLTVMALNSTDMSPMGEKASSRPDIEGESYATPIVALYTHDVALPSGEWISLFEAVQRKFVSTVGPEASQADYLRR